MFQYAFYLNIKTIICLSSTFLLTNPYTFHLPVQFRLMLNHCSHILVLYTMAVWTFEKSRYLLLGLRMLRFAISQKNSVVMFASLLVFLFILLFPSIWSFILNLLLSDNWNVFLGEGKNHCILLGQGHGALRHSFLLLLMTWFDCNCTISTL